MQLLVLMKLFQFVYISDNRKSRLINFYSNQFLLIKLILIRNKCQWMTRSAWICDEAEYSSLCNSDVSRKLCSFQLRHALRLSRGSDKNSTLNSYSSRNQQEKFLRLFQWSVIGMKESFNYVVGSTIVPLYIAAGYYIWKADNRNKAVNKAVFLITIVTRVSYMIILSPPCILYIFFS
jgi:hypothetical protein